MKKLFVFHVVKSILVIIALATLIIFSGCDLLEPKEQEAKFDYEEECKLVAIGETQTKWCTNHNDGEKYPCGTSKPKSYACPDGIQYNVSIH